MGLQTLVHRWFEEVWNQGREETIDELLAENAVAFGLAEGDAPVHGPAEFKVFWKNLRTALPDLRIGIEDMLTDFNKVAVRVVLEGTHQGEGLGVSPTGKRVSVAGVIVLEVADGKISKGWNSWDQLGLLRQIGAYTPPAGPDRFLPANP